jgi:hypothetical protein
MAITGRGTRIRSAWITTRTAGPQFAPATSGRDLQTTIGDFAFEAAAGGTPTTFTYAGAIACSSTIAAPLSKTKAPTVAIAGASSVAAVLSKTKTPAVSVAGASGVAAGLAKTKAPSTAIAGASTVQAPVSKTLVRTGTIPASSGIAAGLAKTVVPSTSIPASSTIAAAVSKTKAPTSSIAATSSVQAPVSKTKAYPSQVAGASTVAATSVLVSAGANVFSYAGAIAGSSGVQAAVAITKAPATGIAASSSVAAVLAKGKAFGGQVSATADPSAAAYRYVDASAPVAHVYAGQVSSSAAVQAAYLVELVVPVSTGGGGHSSRSQGPAASRPGYHLAGPYLAPVSHAPRMFSPAAGVAFSRTTIAARVAFVPAAVIQEADQVVEARGGVYLVPPAPDTRPIQEERERVVVWRSPRPTRTFVAIGAIAARAPRPTSATCYKPDPILERARADDDDALLAILELLEC